MLTLLDVAGSVPASEFQGNIYRGHLEFHSGLDPDASTLCLSSEWCDFHLGSCGQLSGLVRVQSLKSIELVNCRPADASAFSGYVHLIGALLAWRQDVSVKADDELLANTITAAKPDGSLL